MLSSLLRSRPRLVSSTMHFSTTSSSSSSSATVSSSAPLHITHAPKTVTGQPMRPGFNEKGHKILSDADIAEIQRLRALNPTYWGQARLATRFQCSRLMIAKHAPATEERRTIAKRKIQMEYDMARAQSAEARKAMRSDWYARQVEREHAVWTAKLEQKAINKAANEAAHKARMQRKADAAARQFQTASVEPTKK